LTATGSAATGLRILSTLHVAAADFLGDAALHLRSGLAYQTTEVECAHDGKISERLTGSIDGITVVTYSSKTGHD
jgi:hypothetical protein